MENFINKVRDVYQTQINKYPDDLTKALKKACAYFNLTTTAKSQNEHYIKTMIVVYLKYQILYERQIRKIRFTPDTCYACELYRIGCTCDGCPVTQLCEKCTSEIRRNKINHFNVPIELIMLYVKMLRTEIIQKADKGGFSITNL